VVEVAILLGVVWFVWTHVRRAKEPQAA